MVDGEDLPEVPLRPIVWMGDSRKNIREFPEQVRASMGYALQLVQAGEIPLDAKPFKGVGSGVYELVKRYNTDTYRIVYAVKIGENIYVLHAFQKKSKKGIKTPQTDVDLIKQRYRDALEREKQL
ncbi:type II toxin-antitoxin system RelE/ParE family toxin [Aetokthonos hydrillicola Thurmond2011]|jgi:phage-related protein|uniref:Type II toxin-antitoxin system RelE/ParE family toxin n=1 Tax=Aetokthonos hydrillicola Thurmond2011 TaxID=2712845 RepID=A0AAP5M6L8_9CYAN|nr:type II toxin-antitoxin system RelE/ParE family toxin [Aetokthonos hydrillicola]MBO3458566.1 type II toxin-antitoxin system RelE/ParE family toxin [Aetokthonos hydrillicola CCALA 1050]MBW4585009.1 type II toxin-antitoxin system RelE/ParE family toxin [Aetokthonos hydrillicola CCALA 1050]MDR9894230.1 type II toxin-antitoxin system RelE/ParE family toxin [Aetokthonos hydrillicola Thurmond2011]